MEFESYKQFWDAKAATPESGDKPGADAFTAEALNLRLARRLGSRDGKPSGR